ncbi:penicillin-binding protein 2 [Sphaerisporangium sp. TRM90804]|uniref:penicillin-binding protein 2 n=1 Tax=Sphaerisporangium sp. TRM90804 TaxID=3031113 RepID=UPI002448FA2C|nr:penicillin-binding protein 2 [Sphaerisporangium sp. TRM90804]MDH2428123.1 penicillin-binding protein 2 [Sphaerisporangium sp. TRM90804]
MIRVRARLVVLQFVVLTMLAALTVRLWQVQVVRGGQFVAAATETRTRDVIVPAVRGPILDAAGRPLVRNRTALVVSIDRAALERMDDGGAAVLRRLATVLGRPVRELRERIRACGPMVSRPCWPGSLYSPIPLDDKVSTREALQILERQEDFPGVSAEVQPVRDYPLGTGASQTLGYLQPVTEEELRKRSSLKANFSGVDLVGRDGLEYVYDEALRGKSGLRRVQVDRMGKVLGVERQTSPVPGDVLVTHMDVNVQRVVDEALAAAMKNAPRADGAAAVVLDVKTGGVIALGSMPTYNPGVWAGGIAEAEYQRLLSEKAGLPLVSRATHGMYAPGSTFKVSSMAAMVRDGYPLKGKYDCPGSFNVAGTTFNNFHGIGMGTIDLHTALVRSCDTVFYRAAYEMWLRDGGLRPVKRPKEPMTRTAEAFGFGRKTGIDLPGEVAGRIPGRAAKKAMWAATKHTSCLRSKTGYPEVAKKDPGRAAYLKRLANENCLEGFEWKAAEAANLSIGQGDVLVTPLQLAVAYAALVGDGTLRSPRIAKAVIRPDGTHVEEIKSPVVGRLPVDDRTRDYIRAALSEVTSDGTAAGAFSGFPMDVVKIGGKTGTAEVYGKEDTSWFASFAPVGDPRFVVVVTVSQGGQGGMTAAPAARAIYEGIYGIKGKAALPGGEPVKRLPKIRPDGTVVE